MSQQVTSDNVLILFKTTDINTILACLRGVSLVVGSYKSIVTEKWERTFINADFFVNLGASVENNTALITEA